MTLQKIYVIIFKEKLSKSKRTVRTRQIAYQGKHRRVDAKASPVMGESVLAFGCGQLVLILKAVTATGSEERSRRKIRSCNGELPYPLRAKYKLNIFGRRKIA